MMKRYTTFLEAVKEVLEDENVMKQIVAYKQEAMQQIFAERNLKWRLKQMICEAEYDKDESLLIIPEDLKQEVKEFMDDNGRLKMDAIIAAESRLNDHDEKMNDIMKERVIKMLEYVDIEKIDNKVTSRLEEYLNALSVNKKGYSIHYKRDVMETMVNTYNPEWISAWNGNMDMQLCLDYFAVITYISDYYCKDDTGTMQVLQEALKESRNENLRNQLQ